MKTEVTGNEHATMHIRISKRLMLDVDLQLAQLAARHGRRISRSRFVEDAMRAALGKYQADLLE